MGDKYYGDLHICGICKKQFTCLDIFLLHKSKKCNVQDNDSEEMAQDLNFSLEQQDEDVSSLRDGLLGLAATAQELLESSSHPNITREDFSRNDEEDAADVLVNQLSGIGQHHMFEISVNPEMATSNEVHKDSPQESTEIVKQEETSVKTTKKSSGKRKNKKQKDSNPKEVFKCEQLGCKFEGQYYKDLIRHIRIHTGEKPFHCEICQRCFSRADKLKQHLRIHSGDKPFQCNLCSYASVDSSSLKKHQRTHTDERPCKCQLCPYRARDASQLVVHLRTHTGDVPFVCLAPGCKGAFKTSSDLKRHTRLHTDEKPYACDDCDFRTRMKSNLLAHIRRAHLGGHKKYPCNICKNHVAVTYAALVNHRKSHANKLHKCLVKDCDYSGVSLASLKYHQRNKHPEQCVPLHCKHCYFDCITSGQMKSHINECHPTLTSKKYKKQNANKNDKQQQEKTSKSDNNKRYLNFSKLFRCSICGVSYVREDSLRSHIRVHERANSGQKGVVVVDANVMHEEDVDEPEQVILPQQKTIEIHQVSETFTVMNPPIEQHHSTQQVVFYVPSVPNESPDPLLLSPNSGNTLLEQLNLQQGVQYILVPSSATEGFESSVTAPFQQ